MRKSSFRWILCPSVLTLLSSPMKFTVRSSFVSPSHPVERSGKNTKQKKKNHTGNKMCVTVHSRDNGWNSLSPQIKCITQRVGVQKQHLKGLALTPVSICISLLSLRPGEITFPGHICEARGEITFPAHICESRAGKHVHLVTMWCEESQVPAAAREHPTSGRRSL